MRSLRSHYSCFIDKVTNFTYHDGRFIPQNNVISRGVFFWDWNVGNIDD